MITPDQIRAARALVNWSQTELAQRSGLAVPTIANIEAGKQEPSAKTISKIVDTFLIAGIEFIGSKGIQKKEGTTKVFRGESGMREFYDDIYHTIVNEGLEVLVGNADERKFVEALSLDLLHLHMDRMKKIKAKYKILLKEGDYYFAANSYAEYKWTPKNDFQSIPFYVYGNKLAIILWLRDEHIVFLLDSKEASEIYKEKFSILWQQATTPPHDDPQIRDFRDSDKEEFMH